MINCVSHADARLLLLYPIRKVLVTGEVLLVGARRAGVAIGFGSQRGDKNPRFVVRRVKIIKLAYRCFD